MARAVEAIKAPTTEIKVDFIVVSLGTGRNECGGVNECRSIEMRELVELSLDGELERSTVDQTRERSLDL